MHAYGSAHHSRRQKQCVSSSCNLVPPQTMCTSCAPDTVQFCLDSHALVHSVHVALIRANLVARGPSARPWSDQQCMISRKLDTCGWISTVSSWSQRIWTVLLSTSTDSGDWWTKHEFNVFLSAEPSTSWIRINKVDSAYGIPARPTRSSWV
jgi:hypothetical protein